MDYVGIDLHKKTISICVVDQERKVLDRKRFYCNDPGRIVAFFKELGSFQAVVEATASYEWLVSLIEPLADRKDLFSETGVGPVTIDVVLSELGDIHLASGNTSDGASAPAHSPPAPTAWPPPRESHSEARSAWPRCAIQPLRNNRTYSP